MSALERLRGGLIVSVQAEAVLAAERAGRDRRAVPRRRRERRGRRPRRGPGPSRRRAARGRGPHRRHREARVRRVRPVHHRRRARDRRSRRRRRRDRRFRCDRAPASRRPRRAGRGRGDPPPRTAGDGRLRRRRRRAPRRRGRRRRGRDDAVRLHRGDARNGAAGARARPRLRGERGVRDLRRRDRHRRTTSPPRSPPAPQRSSSARRSPTSMRWCGASPGRRPAPGDARASRSREAKRAAERAHPREVGADGSQVLHSWKLSRVRWENGALRRRVPAGKRGLQRGSVGTTSRPAEDEPRPRFLARHRAHRRGFGDHGRTSSNRSTGRSGSSPPAIRRARSTRCSASSVRSRAASSTSS